MLIIKYVRYVKNSENVELKISSSKNFKERENCKKVFLICTESQCKRLHVGTCMIS